MHQLVHYVKLIGVGGLITRAIKSQTNSKFAKYEILTGVPIVRSGFTIWISIEGDSKYLPLYIFEALTSDKDYTEPHNGWRVPRIDRLAIKAWIVDTGLLFWMWREEWVRDDNFDIGWMAIEGLATFLRGLGVVAGRNAIS
jgi:hypothetical protein